MSGLQDAFERFGQRTREAVELAAEAVHATYLDAQSDWFDSEGGGRWPRNRPSTLRQKSRRGHGSKAYVSTGKLRRSLTDPSDPDHVWRVEAQGWEMGTRSSYARHLTGALLVPITGEVKKKIAEAVADAITSRSGGGQP